MLDLCPKSPEDSERIPMDLSNYLIAASPPSSGFDIMGYSLQRSHSNFEIRELETNDNLASHRPFHGPSFRHHRSTCNANYLSKRSEPLKPIIIKTDFSSDSDGESLPESPHSPGRTPKKVSFADHKGLALAEVRFVKEGPDDPPQLNPEILSSLTLGANVCVTSKPPIKLCFPQPASDYLAFRDKVNRNLVCLENVILKDYLATGTIKVKNIAFQKRVFVRLSMDEWRTSEDHEATYVQALGFSVDMIDTFSFKMEISPSFDVCKKVQFAVCFEENGIQHWDNNGGENYCIVSEDYEEKSALLNQSSNSILPRSFNPRWLPEKSTESWTEFSIWREVDLTDRYY